MNDPYYNWIEDKEGAKQRLLFGVLRIPLENTNVKLTNDQGRQMPLTNKLKLFLEVNDVLR